MNVYIYIYKLHTKIIDLYINFIYLFTVTQGGDCNSINKNDNAEAPCPHPGPAQSSLGPFLTVPQPSAPRLAAHSSCPGRGHSEKEGSPFSAHFLFFVWGSARRGQLGRSRRQRKEGRKEIPTSCQERGCLLEVRSALPGSCGSSECWGMGEAVLFCLLSPEHHLTHFMS